LRSPGGRPGAVASVPAAAASASAAASAAVPASGRAARGIERTYGVAPDPAWCAAHRLRQAVQAKGPLFLVLGRRLGDERVSGVS
jgi:hypothetical protein